MERTKENSITVLSTVFNTEIIEVEVVVRDAWWSYKDLSGHVHTSVNFEKTTMRRVTGREWDEDTLEEYDILEYYCVDCSDTIPTPSTHHEKRNMAGLTSGTVNFVSASEVPCGDVVPYVMQDGSIHLMIVTQVAQQSDGTFLCEAILQRK